MVIESDRISGSVERVTFHSEETGFCVLRVKVRGKRNLVTVVGTLPNVTAGEWLEAQGRWIIDRQHGRQLKADSLEVTQPNTLQGIEKYLGSGLIKGIGTQFASRLVDAFGLDVFDVIEKQPERLLRVEGIGPIRRKRITEAWEEQKSVRQIMVFLHSQGVGTSRAFRIYKTYGDEALDKVRENPYCLARDVWGIGFKTADEIASRLGVAKDSEIRARAGVEHTLQQLTEDGHCAYPRDELIKRASELLEIPENRIDEAISQEIAIGTLTEHEFESRTLIYITSLDTAEQLLARHLVRLANAPHPCPSIDVPKALVWVEERLRIRLAKAQRQALRTATKAKAMVITGGPGVGKTTLVNSIVRIFEAKGLRIRLAAPTGRAAKRLSEATGNEAKTIHRLLEFEPRTGRFKHNQTNPLTGDLFIIDETSMIDLVLAYQLIRAIPEHAALILVGDVDQLPSVGPGNVLRDIINSKVILVEKLDQVFRQAAESTIITNAHRINAGELPIWPEAREGIATKSDFYFIPCPDPEKGVDVIQRLVKDRIPDRFGFNPLRDIQVLTPMQRGDLGARHLNLALQSILNPTEAGVSRYGYRFSVGDKVMQIVNNYDKDVFNGDIGIIDQIRSEDRELVVRYEDRRVVYDFEELDELVLSYATTIHKSQGSEYPCVVIPIHTQHYILLQRNLLYTAVTRGKSLVVLVGTLKALTISVKTVEARQRITTLRERLVSLGPR
ncbi:MAG TPA: ATP-dependent RecD-like DNA helicase [Acidobacteriota bacterium]|nr:ATP-dependent RecD-like DNA helicase [Acidobacteriota bacterium]